jgi:hypothetical protein
MKRLFLILLLACAIYESPLNAQPTCGTADASLLRIGYHTGNRVGISFYNDGQIAGFNQGVDIRGEWPLGSGENYIGDCIPLIGVEFTSTVGETLHSVIISRGPRNRQSEERDPITRQFRGWNPVPGFLNPNGRSVAMSHIPSSWPIGGWCDEPTWVDLNGNTQWNGYFGRGIANADQESYFQSDDQTDNEFNSSFMPDSTNPSRKGMGLRLARRGFQWSSFLAEDAIFWLYDITNDGTTTYRKAVFGTTVGTLAGGDGDSQDDLGFFDIDQSITYSWDSDGKGNKGQKVGYVAYAYLESPGNPVDGIDNDDDSPSPDSPKFTATSFDSVRYAAGDRVVLIDPVTYERSIHTVAATVDTVYSLGVRFIIQPTGSKFREGHIAAVVDGINVPAGSSYDGIDNDLDGIIDENESVHYQARASKGLPGLRYKNFLTGAGVTDPLIDEQRDNDAGTLITSYQTLPNGTVALVTHWSGDEDADWVASFDDVGSDGLGPEDEGYISPDPDGTEGNGHPDQGEPNFGKTDPDESDQIGLTSFNFFNISAAPAMDDDASLWTRMTPGKFDVIPRQPQDGDFIYASGYFPLRPKQTERFSVALLFGENYQDILRNKNIVQQIYNSGYKFPQPPKKPKITITEEDGKVVLYWDSKPVENSRDFILKRKDFQGYKIYRATDAGFQDARTVTDALGVFAFDKPIAQFDLVDTIQGFFNASPALLDQVGGTTFYLGSNTGVTNRFVDSTVIPGVRYYYAVVAYDAGEPGLNIFPSENSKFIFRTNTGQVITDDNTAYITPGKPPIGYVDARPSNVEKQPNFRGTGSAFVEVIDDKAVKDGHTYQIVFEDTALQGYTSNWSLLDMDTPDTVFLPTTGETILLKPGESLSVPKDAGILVNSKESLIESGNFIAAYDTVVKRDTIYYGNTPIVDGFKVQLMNDSQILKDSVNSGFRDQSSVPAPGYTFAPFVWTSTGPGVAYNGIMMPYDYVVEFDSVVVDTSVADTLYPNTPGNRIPAQPVKFRVKNLTTDQYIDFVYFRTGTLSTIHNIWFKENIGGQIRRTWRVNLLYITPAAPTEQAGTLRLFTLKPFSRNDIFQFTMHGPEINTQLAKADLEKIKVVPNPYVVTHVGEPRLLSTQTSGRGERVIRFTHVPPGSKISIFTVRGELIRTLRQDDLFNGDVFWNLRTSENMDAAYGVYVYVVEAPEIGTKTGKFALIK